MEENIERLKYIGISIGEDVKIYDSYIDETWGEFITIGNHVTISCASILAHDASMQRGTGKVKVGKVIIGDHVFVGYHSIILPNVKVGNKVVIGAGTVVAKNIPDNSICVGNPMHIIGTYDEYVNKHLEQIAREPSCNIFDEEKAFTDLKSELLLEMKNGIGYVY